jgi:hypothetical protein
MFTNSSGCWTQGAIQDTSFGNSCAVADQHAGFGGWRILADQVLRGGASNSTGGNEIRAA